MGKFIDRIGEENIAKNGMKMKIIAYRSCHDIDIEFEDGIRVYHRRYSIFKKGEIGHPNFNSCTEIAKKKQQLNLLK